MTAHRVVGDDVLDDRVDTHVLAGGHGVSGGRQPLHQRRQQGPGPRPLAEALQALLVDVDDARRRLLRVEGAGFDLLIAVEDLALW